jgi:hypothetical protein
MNPTGSDVPTTRTSFEMKQSTNQALLAIGADAPQPKRQRSHGETHMTSKERVLTVLARQVPDRVPINYDANPGIDARLKAHFGLAPDDWAGLRDALGVDVRGVGAPYVGTRLHTERPERQVDGVWGWITRYVEHGQGGYWDFCDFPLAAADEETVARWPLPSPDDYDYSQVADDCRRNREYAVHVGNPGLACIMNTSGFLRGMEQMFVDLATDEPAGLLLIDRMLTVQLETTRRVLEAAKGGIDFLWIGEDLDCSVMRCDAKASHKFKRRIGIEL